MPTFGWAPQWFRKLGLFQVFRPLAVGIVHGLAGSAAVALLVLTTISQPRWAIGYLLVFGIGTIMGMMLITETDTEIIAHLIEQVQLDAEAAGAPIPLEVAVRRAVKRLTGAFALVFGRSASWTRSSPGFGPPVVIGVGEESTLSPPMRPASSAIPATSTSWRTATWPS